MTRILISFPIRVLIYSVIKCSEPKLVGLFPTLFNESCTPVSFTRLKQLFRPSVSQIHGQIRGGGRAAVDRETWLTPLH